MKNQSARLVSRAWAPWLKTVSCLLSVLLLFYAVPTIVYAELIASVESAFDSAEAPSKITHDGDASDHAVFEIIDRREETVKHFRTEDGSFTAVQYNVPVHEKDENGEWQDIDNTLSESGSEYATSNARVKFAKKTTGNETLFTLHDGNRKITMSLSGANKKVAGQVTNTQTEFPEDATQLQKLMTLDKLSSKILYPNILDGVDLEYVVESCNIKENIIVKERADSYSYTFEIQLNNLAAVLCEDGSVAISDPDTDEIVYTIPKGYMFDADGEYSDAVTYTLTNGGNGKYALTVAADTTWINAEGRAFPVTVDPPINSTAAASGIVDTYIDSDNPTYAYSNRSFLASGTGSKGQEFISYWKLNSLPTIPANAFIVSAEFSLYCQDYRVHSGSASSVKIGVHQVTTDWTANITWTGHTVNNAGAFSSATLIDYAEVRGGSESHYVSWDITRLYKMWNEGATNYGVALAQLKQGSRDALFASSETANDPRLMIHYRDMKGMESYWSGSSHSAGLAGSGYVNHANGNLVFSIGTVATTDSLFNYTPSLVYNAALTDKYNYTSHNSNVPYRIMSTGYGWKLSTNESIARPLNSDYYIWSDGDGTEHYFLPDTSSTPTVYKDEDGLLLTLTASNNGYTIEDIDGNIRYFKKITTSTAIAEGGTLEYIQDIYGNQLQFTLNDYGQTTAISVKPKGHSTPINYLTFTYNSLHALTEIRNAVTQQVVSFTYAMSYTNTTSVGSIYAGPLYQVKYGHLSGSTVAYDATTTYTYTSAMGPTYGNIYRLATATDDSTGLSIHYSYDTSGRITTVTEYNGTTAGQSILYTYGKGYAEIRNSGSDDILQPGVKCDDIISHYSLDYQGRAVSAYTTNAARTAMYGATNNAFEYQNLEERGDSGNSKNKLKASAVTNGVAVNHVYNGGFEINFDSTEGICGWTSSPSNTFGYSSIPILRIGRMISATVTASDQYIEQTVTLPAGTYTLSADIYSYEADGATVTLGAQVNGSWKEEEYTLYTIANDANVLSPTLTFTVDDNTDTSNVKIRLTLNGNGSTGKTVYIDNVMLENNIGAGAFNAVQFGGFENTYTSSTLTNPVSEYWDIYYANEVDFATGDFTNDCLVISGDVNAYQWVFQRITVTDDMSLAQCENGIFSPIHLARSRTFTVSGFAKGNAQIANERADFSLSVDIYYYGNDGNMPDETLFFDFNKELTDWQFVSGTFCTPADQIVRYIDVCCIYGNQPNEAYFDNISLVEEKGTNTANYIYNENGLLEFTRTPSDCVYYEYDSNNNLIFAYDSQGNGHYNQYSGNILLSETTFKYDTSFVHDEKELDLLEWYLMYGEPTGENLIDQLTCTAISKTVYNINTYGLNTSTVSYAATGAVRTATQKTGTPRLSSSTVYNLTAGSPLFGRMTSATNTAGNTTRYGYDAQGKLIYETNASNEGLFYNYDALGRLTGVMPLQYSTSVNVFFPESGAENVQYTYDPQTLRLTQITTDSTTYAFTYDEFGNTTQITAGGNILAQYEYNSYNGKLMRMTYGTEKVITYLYDELDRIQEISYTAASGTESYKYTYTASGAIHSVEATESGRLYLYNYDSKGQLIGYTECGKDPNDMNTEYTAQLQNNYVYDEQDRIYFWQGAFNYTASNGSVYMDSVAYYYEYEDYGDSANSNSVTNVGELYQLEIMGAGYSSNALITYGYDPLYRPASKEMAIDAGWKITTEYTYRSTNNVTSSLVSRYVSAVTGNSAPATTTYSYTYDVDGNITQIVDGNGKKIIYIYDDLGQLTRENNEVLEKAFVYTYDNAGNRTSKTTYSYVSGVTGAQISGETYTYGNAWGDQLTKVGSTTISYDEIGNPTTYNGYDLTWHGRQLKEMEKTNSVIKFLYNADGIRTNKIVNGTDHIYTLNGSQIVSEAWGTNLLIFLYDESGLPIGMQYRNTSHDSYEFITFYFEKNLQGDIIAVYNENGVKVLSYTYDAWGCHTPQWVNSTGDNIYAVYNPFRYRGYYYDTETQLYYLQSRYYNPQWGRFLNADAIYYLGDNYSLPGYNLYAYCCNNPIMFSDPTGHFVGTLIAGFALGVLGGAAVDYVLQLVNNDFDFGNIDYGSVANSAIVGGGLGLSSAIGVITLGPALASGGIIGTKVLHGLCAAATISFSAGAIGYMTENLMNKTYWNPAAAVMHGVFVTMEGLHCYVAGGTSGSWGKIGTKGPLISVEKVYKTLNELMFTTPHKIIINIIREQLEETFEYGFY